MLVIYADHSSGTLLGLDKNLTAAANNVKDLGVLIDDMVNFSCSYQSHNCKIIH